MIGLDKHVVDGRIENVPEKDDKANPEFEPTQHETDP